MAPRNKKPSSSDKQRGGDEDREEVLQAVILADSFETRFRPFTLEKPRCLLPLANTPLIEYTLEFLANAGVDEVFVYCGAHAEQVEDYIQRSRWDSTSSPFSRLELIRSTARSIGDAMRDLDKRAVLTGDFVVVYGDVVSNLPLEGAIAAHRARRAADRNAIMTMVLRQAGAMHRTKEQNTRPVFVIDPTKDRCLHFEQMRPKREGDSGHFVSIDPEILSEHQEIEIRQDLIDCGIDICTPEALSLWSDNFDFDAPRKGFLHGVLKDYELNGKTIHTHIVTDHYAARVRNLHAYESISKDIVARWAYPICPDTNLLRGQSYRMQKGNIYMESGVMLARSCVINARTVIGMQSTIGEGSVISNSVIGKRCTIGKNVVIDGAYIWDDVTVLDRSVVQQAIIAAGARIGQGCNVQPGALISYSVTVRDGVTVESTSKLTRKKRTHEGSQESVVAEPNVQVVGEGGEVFNYGGSDSDSDEEHLNGIGATGLVYGMAHLAVSAESISTLQSESDFSDESVHRDRSARGSFVSVESDDSHLGAHAGDFHHEAAASVFDSLQKGDESTNILLELNALRMSTNASPHQVRRAIVAAFMKHVAQLVDGGTVVKKAVEDTLRPHREIFRRNFFDFDQDDKVDQLDFLHLVQADLAHRKSGGSIMLYVSYELLTTDILQEETFEQWWHDNKSQETEELRTVRAGMQQFMDAILPETESEESEEEDDEEDESEEA